MIYRLGSLGDTIVALPCFHLIARSFPNAQRWVLTSRIRDSKASAISTVLENSGLIDGYLDYPTRLRNFRELMELRKRIQNWSPDLLIYLTEPRGQFNTLRDTAFFLSCGITRMVGIPYKSSLAKPQWLPARAQYEPEAKRLARCLRKLGDARLQQHEAWDLKLTSSEEARAEQVLSDWSGKERFMVCSVGARIPSKDWGEENWLNFLRQLSSNYPLLGLVLIGANDEFTRSESAKGCWHGPVQNLCGKLTPRESAALLKRACLFVGHDSGPMHLAAAVNTPCVAIFSARNKPAVWFPYGLHHRVIYHQTECYGCGLEVCTQHSKKCITSITVNEVVAAVQDVLKKSIQSPDYASIPQTMIA